MEVIFEQKKFMELYDVGFVFVYKFKNNEFRKMFLKIIVILLRFVLYQINMEKMYEQFGFLLVLLIMDDENGYMIFVDVVIFLLVRQLIDEL